ncbi:MAG TPA: MBOAT family O-acyltransferase [Labilithrix sp.]|jgi:D-alanyl-lipoteichoic acid acyltransferase DltB (MBOAT superfamily)
MRLDSVRFLLVFAVFFVAYTLAPPRAKRWLLVAGNLGFYATLSPKWLPLLLGLGVYNFVVGSQLKRVPRLLYVGIAVNVAALAFFRGSALGVSFYALQAISFLVDISRGMYEPPKSALSFLASFTLFPHLLSGPIVRSSFLVPLVERAETPAWTTARRALLLFVAGLVKKAVADKLAPIADHAFDASHAISPLDAWTGLLAYAGQLYGDFAGYTDTATALALLLGLDLPPNFDLPYLATSPADFWRRWHISLSSWLRDYIYMPLGVRFRRRRYTNVILTWLVAGLWHGTSPLFVLSGLYHGVLLAITDALTRRFGTDDGPHGIRRVAQTVLTFYLVLMGYVLFRARSLAAAGAFYASLHVPRVASSFSRDALATVATCVSAIVFCHVLDYAVRRREPAERAWVMWPAMAVAIALLVLFRAAPSPFIYFAF